MNITKINNITLIFNIIFCYNINPEKNNSPVLNLTSMALKIVIFMYIQFNLKPTVKRLLIYIYLGNEIN